MPTELDSTGERLALTVRCMAPGDFEQIMRLERRAFSDAWPVKKMRELTLHPGARFFVLEHATRRHRRRNPLRRSQLLLLGYLGYIVEDDCATVLSVVIDPDCMGQKLGELLVWAAIQEVERTGVPRIKAQVRMSNAVALRLYDKYGFRVVGELPDFYDSPSEGAYDMEVSVADREHRPGVDGFTSVIPTRFDVIDHVTPQA